MTPFEVYIDYLALTRHFSDEKYDYIKYQGKVKANKNSFDARKDRIFFERLAKHAADPHTSILSSIVSQRGKRVWIRDIAYKQSEQVLTDFNKIHESLSYIVRQQLSQFDIPFDQLVRVPPNSHPPLLTSYMTGSVNIETVIVVIDVCGAYASWKKNLEADPVARSILFFIDKYRPFITYDKDKIVKIIVDIFADKI